MTEDTQKELFELPAPSYRQRDERGRFVKGNLIAKRGGQGSTLIAKAS